MIQQIDESTSYEKNNGESIKISSSFTVKWLLIVKNLIIWHEGV